MLRPRPCKYRAHLADKRALHPQRSGLIKKIAHLRGENSEPSPRPKNDRVVVGQFSYCRNRRFLINLEPGLLCHLFRDQFRHPLDVSFGARVPYAFCYSLSHALHVAVRGIIEDENLSHVFTSLSAALAKLVSGLKVCSARVTRREVSHADNSVKYSWFMTTDKTYVRASNFIYWPFEVHF